VQAKTPESMLPGLIHTLLTDKAALDKSCDALMAILAACVAKMYGIFGAPKFSTLFESIISRGGAEL